MLERQIRDLIEFIRLLYPGENPISLHAPRFSGKEREYVLDCIDSTFVSSVGEYVTRFERQIAEYTGAKYAIACVNGTSALHVALLAAGVKLGDAVLTQGLTFVATANAITYAGAVPIFLDVDEDSLGLSPNAIANFISGECETRGGKLFHKASGRKISACVPMHTFGFPCKIDEIKTLCLENNIVLVEDAAESLGSWYKNFHTGRFGKMGVFSFNGNKVLTTGGGGMVITDDDELGVWLKHITTTAKCPHAWKFVHDQIGFNYRMPNINAALGVSQMEYFSNTIANKRKLAGLYSDFLNNSPWIFFTGLNDSEPNFWLNTMMVRDESERDRVLEATNNTGIQTRPVWELMVDLPIYRSAYRDTLNNSRIFSRKLVNLPSSLKDRHDSR